MADPLDKIPGEIARGAVRGLIDWVADWWTGRRKPTAPPGEPPEPERGILLIGPGGVGKTTLARLLAGDTAVLHPLWEYAESLAVEEYAVADRPGVEVVVPPGQRHRRDSWTALLDGVARGDYRGVVLVAAYGFHTPDFASYRTQVKEGETKDRYFERYSAERRAEEVETFRAIADAFRRCPDRVWLLVVVTKQDLWADEQKQVESFYTTGSFGEVADGLRQAMTGRPFRAETAFTCLTIANLETLKRERLRSNTAGYDQRQSVSSLLRLLDTVKALIDWENGR